MFNDFPIPKLFPARESLVSDIPAGMGKSLTFFTVIVTLASMTCLFYDVKETPPGGYSVVSPSLHILYKVSSH
jgi:hypothetical protein